MWFVNTFIRLCAPLQYSHRYSSHSSQNDTGGMSLLVHMPQDFLLAIRLRIRNVCRTAKSVRNASVPLTGTLCFALHCGQMSVSFCPDFFRIRSRQPLQNVWQHGSTLGSLNSSRHTLHVRSSCSFSAILLKVSSHLGVLPAQVKS